jgi:hypothetical protein
LTALRSPTFSSLFLFAVVINVAAIAIFGSQAYRTLRKRNTI